MSKAIVFDVDETLGHFSQLYHLWNLINKYFEQKNRYTKIINSQFLFNLLLDTFPNYLRTNIFLVFSYILKEKQKNNIQKIILYTNNKISKEWIFFIANYFEYKLNGKIFDEIICAYKIDSRRTTHEKTYSDLINIAELKDYKICFVDDLIHKKMLHPHVFYIYIPPCFYHYPINTFLELFLGVIDIEVDDFTKYIREEYKQKINHKVPQLKSLELLNKVKYFLQI